MAKSITSFKDVRKVNENLLIVEFHTIYHKDTKGKLVDYKRERAKFNDGVDKKIWKKQKAKRPYCTVKQCSNNCEDWIYTEVYVRYSVKI